MRVAFILCFLLLRLPALAQPDVPAEGRWVTDLAGLLDESTEQIITELLVTHQDSTRNQVVVVTVPSLQGGAIEAYVRRIFNTWGVGQEGRP